MSQYINFFIRIGDRFISIADYSRNTEMYNVMSDAPYEKVREYSYNELQLKLAKLYTAITANLKEISKWKERIKMVLDMKNNSIEEKSDAIAFLNETIDDIQQMNDAIDKQIIELDFIAELIYKDYRIYAGFEIGDPTIQDIVES